MKATSRRIRPSPRRHHRCSPRPPTQTWPRVGRSWPWMRRSRVVLPAPLGPVISTSSPRPTLKLMSTKTALRPKRLVTCEMRTAAAGFGAGSATPFVAGRATACPLVAGLSASATRSRTVAAVPFDTTPPCPTLSASRLAQAGQKKGNKKGRPKLGRPRVSYSVRSVAVGRLHEVWDQVRRVRRSEARDGIPAGCGRVAGDSRVGRVVAGGHVEEVVCVTSRARPERVKRGVDESEPAAVDLVGDGDQAGPLRAAQR